MLVSLPGMLQETNRRRQPSQGAIFFDMRENIFMDTPFLRSKALNVHCDVAIALWVAIPQMEVLVETLPFNCTSSRQCQSRATPTVGCRIIGEMPEGTLERSGQIGEVSIVIEIDCYGESTIDIGSDSHELFIPE